MAIELYTIETEQDREKTLRMCANDVKIVPKLHMSMGVPYDKPKITSGDR